MEESSSSLDQRRIQMGQSPTEFFLGNTDHFSTGIVPAPIEKFNSINTTKKSKKKASKAPKIVSSVIPTPVPISEMATATAIMMQPSMQSSYTMETFDPAPPQPQPQPIPEKSFSSNQKTKKNKKTMSTKDKTKLWDIFDHDKKEMSTEESLSSLPVECVYEEKKENDFCHLCNAILMVIEDGFPTCTNPSCGIIYKNTLDYSPEWRFYGADDKNATDPTRCGNPINPLLMESSFGCKILCSMRSSYEMKKIRKWTEWQSMPHKEKSLYDEFQFITVMAQNAGIPKIFIDHAMAIHKDISEQKMFRGLNRDGIKAASIYISCRLNGCPRTAHEISEIFRLDKTSATSGCSTAVNILHNIERNVEPSQQTDLCSTTPGSFIERYCSKLNINGELTLLSKFVAQKIQNSNIILENTPHAMAAGIVYFIAQSCNLNISKQEIKQVCGVSEVTINKCFKKLEKIKDQLVPSCILSKYA
jgi:transcription initiation factor TFIIB